MRREWQERVDGAIVSWGYDGAGDVHLAHGAAGDARLRPHISPCPTRSRSCASTTCASAASRSRAKRGASSATLLGTEPLAPDAQILQMASVRLPEPQPDLSQRLFDEHRIEIPTMGPRRDDLLRISIAPYTEREDVERLLDALPPRSELPAALRDVQADERTELCAVLRAPAVVLTGFQKPTPETLAVAPSGCQSVVRPGIA